MQETHTGIFPMKPKVSPEINEITPAHAVIASSILIEFASVISPVDTRNFQVGIDQTHTKLHKIENSNSMSATERTFEPILS
jgi:hypothetical protein